MADEVFKRILIIADIEGSSGCWSYRGASFRTPEWARACVAMSKDVDAVVRALYRADVERVRITDFHRTGYNLLPELIDSRAELIPGYRRGPVPGIGDPDHADALLLLGMHAASGSTGFLSHTFTSRIQSLRVNGASWPEAAFFCASVAPYGVRPIFFSGCPVACREARRMIPGIRTEAIDKSIPPARFDAVDWRSRLAAGAAGALSHRRAAPVRMTGPFRAVVQVRGGASTAQRLAGRWGLTCSGSQIIIDADDFDALYMAVIRLCYLAPMPDRLLSAGLALFHLRGRLGLKWARRRARQMGLLEE